MSQIHLSSGSFPPPPIVATTYTADDATTATPALNNLNLFSNDSTSYNANGISSTASGSTVTYRLNNRVQGTTSTVGAVTGDVITFAMGATPGTFKFNVDIAGFDSSTPTGAGFGVEVCAITDGATCTVIDTDVTRQRAAATNATDCTAVASVNNLIFRLTGQAGLTINWSASGIYERAV